jgi:Fe-S cluster biogenesis protein NfuA
MTELEKDTMFERVNKALDDIRPHLAVDDGNIEVVDITDDFEVMVRWLGNCEFCSMSAMTMRAGVEQAIKARVSEVSKITAVNGML